MRYGRNEMLSLTELLSTEDRIERVYWVQQRRNNKQLGWDARLRLSCGLYTLLHYDSDSHAESVAVLLLLGVRSVVHITAPGRSEVALSLR